MPCFLKRTSAASRRALPAKRRANGSARSPSGTARVAARADYRTRTGTSKFRDKCNAGKPHLLARLFGADPHAWSYDEFNSPKLNAEPGFLAKSGDYRECASDYGVYDMVGNLHEWVSDTVDRRLPLKLPLRDDIRDRIRVNTGHGIFMGGFYSTTSEHGRGCAFVTIAHEPKYHDYSTGFRCCRDAAPPSQ